MGEGAVWEMGEMGEVGEVGAMGKRGRIKFFELKILNLRRVGFAHQSRIF